MTSDTPEHGTDGKLGKIAGRSDQGKNIVHTIDPLFILGIADVSAFGAKKYHMRNFLMSPGMQWSRVYDSAMRHLMKHWSGEDFDDESGLPHILMASWNMMVLFTYWKHEQYHIGDDRPSKIEFEGHRWQNWSEAFSREQEMAANGESFLSDKDIEEVTISKPDELLDRLVGGEDPEVIAKEYSQYKKFKGTVDPVFFRDSVRGHFASKNKG